MLYSQKREAAALDLIYTYLSFIHHAQNDVGNFRNFMDYNRTFVEESGSQDCQGRTLWALGTALSCSSVLPDNLQNTCRYLMNQALPEIAGLTSPRAIAYALVGLSHLAATPGAAAYAFPYPHTPTTAEELAFLPQGRITELIEQLALRLLSRYKDNKANGWSWLEDSLTYGNAMVPWALLRAFRLCRNADMLAAAKESLDFLALQTFAAEGYYKPIGSHGWLSRGGEAAPYDEQPIEACEMLLACQEAADVLGDSSYLRQAALCYEWYLGHNSLRQSLIDPQTGACYDGIHATGLNLNQGSESMISFSIAHLAVSHG
jgi:hypothetical protein